MKNPESIEITRNNCTESIGPNSLQTLPPSEYFSMRQRKKCDDCCKTKQAHVGRDNIKTNVIYILIITVVVLIGLLSFAGFLLFERINSVLVVDKSKLGRSSKLEQRFWYDDAFNDLKKSIEFEPNKGQAKNIVIFVGDGMGLSTTTASRIYKHGEEGLFSWEKFPHFGLLKVRVEQVAILDSNF